jgi:hypothetical protein
MLWELERMKDDTIFNQVTSIRRRAGVARSVTSGYGLDNAAIEVRTPERQEDLPSKLCVQTVSGVHLASCPMGTRGPFPSGKARPRRDADHSPPSSAEVVNE